jgi:hypothetical protein
VPACYLRVVHPRLGWLVVVLALGAGCAQHSSLVAHTGHHRLTARDAQTGVTVIVTTDVWNGHPRELDRELTILHVLVANMGKDPVLLAPGDLELRDERGFRYELYDPGATFHRVRDEGSYGRDYGRRYDIGRSNAFVAVLGPGEMAERALPWGVLEPGTQMRGFVYFDPLERTANAGRLVWHLQTPDHRPLVDAAFDLYVARPR